MGQHEQLGQRQGVAPLEWCLFSVLRRTVLHVHPLKYAPKVRCPLMPRVEE